MISGVLIVNVDFIWLMIEFVNLLVQDVWDIIEEFVLIVYLITNSEVDHVKLMDAKITKGITVKDAKIIT